MGSPFNGHFALGYDQQKKKYISSWIDSLSSSMMTSEGAYDESTKTLTLTGESPSCMDGSIKKHTVAHVIKDKDTSVMTMSMPGPDGKPQTAMEITYKRKK